MPLTYKETSTPIVEPITLAQAKTQCVVDADDTGYDAQLGVWILAARIYAERRLRRAIFPRGVQLLLDHFPYPEPGTTVNPNDRHSLYGEIWHQLAVRLPLPRCLAVQSIEYIPLGGGALVALDPLTYYTDPDSEPARIVPIPGQYWPYTQSWLPNSVRVNYTAGSFAGTVAGEAVAVAGDGALPLAGLAKFVGMATLVNGAGTAVAYTQAAAAAGTPAPAPKVDRALSGQTLTASYYVDSCPETVRQAMLLLVSHWFSNRDAAAVNVPKAIEFGVDALLGVEAFDTFGY